MTRQAALEKIGRALSLLAIGTRAENLAGMFSKNRVTEDLLLPVFREIFRAPNLRNLNNDTLNQAHIDLADDQNRLSIQVTTERAASKVAETLQGYSAKGYWKKYDRLIVFILTIQRPNFHKRSKGEWENICAGKFSFVPSRDIIVPEDLLNLIGACKDEVVYEIERTLSKSIVGEDYVDFQSKLQDKCIEQLAFEKQSAKYIPDVFVETQNLKELARVFAHPTLFHRRTIDQLSRFHLESANRFLSKCGLRELPSLPEYSLPSDLTLKEVLLFANNLRADLQAWLSPVSELEKIRSSADARGFADPDRFYVLEENIYNVNPVASGLRDSAEKIINEASACSSQIFIVTGRAGQGKTNFVCDFLEKFLLRHIVPCAHLSARTLEAISSDNLPDAIQKYLFDGKIQTFREAAGLLSDYCDKIGRPFILIIDGLNEHHELGKFASQLEHLFREWIKFPNLKLLITCRSEFFQERFGNLMSLGLNQYIFLHESNERSLDREFFKDAKDAYFDFFEINEEQISADAKSALSRDILLLRFFCEAYGARGKSEDYVQPFISNIYREQIFEIYLNRKLGTANTFLYRGSGALYPSRAKDQLLKVIEMVVAHMVESRNFSDVPIGIIPDNLKDALYTLLDEDLVLRRDLSKNCSIFSMGEEMVNFTFDEFRDYLISQFLFERVYKEDVEKFLLFQESIKPEVTQALEGLKRFLFYISRKPENSEFLNFYKESPWYQDVFEGEIFNVDPTYLNEEDRERIKQCLHRTDHRSRELAVRLAIRWKDTILGLELLCEVAESADENVFNNIIIEAFRKSQFNEGVCAEEFAEFVEADILPEFEAGKFAAVDGLFRFLVLLFPVDSSPILDSPAEIVFRMLLKGDSVFGVSLLERSLKFRSFSMRPHVWRLLALCLNHITMDSYIFERAVADSICDNMLVAHEASRVVEMVVKY